jgi:hypothetical protein
MAKVTRPGTVTVELTLAELALIKEALATELAMSDQNNIIELNELILDLKREH